MPSADDIAKKLKSMSNPDKVKGMSKFGITLEKRLKKMLSQSSQSSQGKTKTK